MGKVVFGVGRRRVKTFILLQNPLTPERSLKDFGMVSEGVSEGSLKAPRTCQRKGPSNPFKTPSRTFRKTFPEGVEIDDELGFQGLKI